MGFENVVDDVAVLLDEIHDGVGCFSRHYGLVGAAVTDRIEDYAMASGGICYDVLPCLCRFGVDFVDDW